MSDPAPRPSVSRIDMARDVVILVALYLACHCLVWRDARGPDTTDAPEALRGWLLVEAAPKAMAAALVATAGTAVLTLLALLYRKNRWLLALPAVLLAFDAILISWSIELDGRRWGGLREGLLLATLTQLWLGGLALAVAAGVGADQ